MKKIKYFMFVILLLPIFVNAKSFEQSYVNSKGVEISEKAYNFFLEIGLNEAMIDNMVQETYDSYGPFDIIASNSAEKYFRETTFNSYKNNYTIVEEISEEDYNLEIPVDLNLLRKNNSGIMPLVDDKSASHETTYKKLTLTLFQTDYVYPAKRNGVAKLVWKKLPKVTSYDIFAVRATGGSFSATGFFGSMTNTQLIPIGDLCQLTRYQDYTTSYNYSNSAWNTTGNDISKTGIGFTAKLNSTPNEVCFTDISTTSSIITGYSSILSFNGAASTNNGKLTVYASYQHAQETVNYNSIYRAYTFSNSGLGNVIYFSNSSLRNAYDGMAGVNVTL